MNIFIYLFNVIFYTNVPYKSEMINISVGFELKLRKHAENISVITGIECCVVEESGSGLLPNLYCNNSCHLKNEQCDGIKPHLYGCDEAHRWDGEYIYYCPAGFAFTANSIYKKDSFYGAFITGPMIMENYSDEGKGNIRVVSTSAVSSLISVVTAVSGFINVEGEKRADVENSREILNTMYELVGSYDTLGEKQYPIELEKQLQTYIAIGDKSGAQEILNLLLGHIFFSNSGDFEVIKARIIELIVLLSRAAIDGGADIKQIFYLNKDYLRKIETLNNLDDLGRWLTNVMHKFVSFIFDFADVKHVDIIFKVIQYVKDHYREKITLDDVASHVYLSRSYLSKVFNEELGCNFTTYINRLRIENSKALLLNNSINIVDVAFMVGFDDQSYFTKVFKKNAGISPGKYRELRGKIK